MDTRSLEHAAPALDHAAPALEHAAPALDHAPEPTAPAETTPSALSAATLALAEIAANAESERGSDIDLIEGTAEDTAGPTVLADLISAGLVTHEMIGDPARLGSEAEALRLLCALVSGPIWRIEPFHYAFRADPDGVPEERAVAIEAALSAELGAGSVWVSATEQPEPTDLDQPILLLRAQGQAVQAAVEAADSTLHAVVSARFAAATARIAADAVTEAATSAVAAGGAAGHSLVERMEALAARQEETLGGILGAVTARADLSEALNRLGATIGQLMQRLDAQAEVLQAHIAREDLVAGRLAELSAMAGTPAAFQETLGLTLAEFLAQIETKVEIPERAVGAGPVEAVRTAQVS